MYLAPPVPHCKIKGIVTREKEVFLPGHVGFALALVAIFFCSLDFLFYFALYSLKCVSH